MIAIYCQSNCKTQLTLCDDCKEILDYIWKKLDNCQYKIRKPRCNKCPRHCYSVSKREKIKKIMRYSGPLMIWKHPLLTLIHFLK